MLIVPLALCLILLLLYLNFGSLRYALLIFSAIPLATIGGIWMLLVRDLPFSISAAVGFIALFGIAVLNSVVLVAEYLHQKNQTDAPVLQLLIQTLDNRLRPILLTAAVAALGFLPMAFSSSKGAEIQQPLASVVIGGLISSTFLTLFVLPCLILWVEEKKEKSALP